METDKLHTFITVAKYKSFNKASQHLYISSVAIMKQISSLEKFFGLPLLTRKHTGVELTPAGLSLLKDAQKIIDDLNKAEQNLKKFDQRPTIIRIGTSILNPATKYQALWNKLKERYPHYQFNYVSVSDDGNTPYSFVGNEVDLMIGAGDLYHQKGLLTIPLFKANFEISMLTSNPLARAESLTIADLKGQNLYIIPQNEDRFVDQLRTQFHSNHIQTKVTNAVYSVNTFNNIKGNNDCLLSLDYWTQSRPDIVSVPLKTSIKMPINFIINQHSSTEIINIFNYVKQLKINQ